MSTQYTWSNIIEFVSDVLEKEGARPNASTVRMLGNKALGIMADRTDMLSGTIWTNSTTVFPITTNRASLPIDCLGVDSVEWDGVLLERTTFDWLDENIDGWRTATGTPTYFVATGDALVFDTNPTVTTAGLLVVRGRALPADFSDSVGATNPLAYFPSHFQIAPAYYILAELPFDPEKPIERMRWEKYSAMWSNELQALSGAMNTRRYERFSY